MINNGPSKKNDNRAAALVKHFQAGVGIALLECTVPKLKSLGLKQKAVAKRIGIGQGTLSRWLSGNDDITFGQFICTLKAMDLNLADIDFPDDFEMALSGLHHAMRHHPESDKQLCELRKKDVLWLMQAFRKASPELREKAMAISFARFRQNPKQPDFYQISARLMEILRNDLDSLGVTNDIDPAVCFGDWAAILFDCDRILQRCEIYDDLENHPQLSDGALP